MPGQGSRMHTMIGPGSRMAWAGVARAAAHAAAAMTMRAIRVARLRIPGNSTTTARVPAQ